MRTGADALRSFHHFVWKVLDDDIPPLWQNEQRPWEVRLWGTEGEFGFPFARVAAITAESFSGSAAIRESARTFAAHLYPVPQASPEESIMEVERVEELLTVAFECGFRYTEPLMPPYSVEARPAGDGSLAHGVYTYEITSVNASGESEAALAYYGSLGDGASIAFTWTQALGAASYNLYRTGPDLVRKLIAGLPGLAIRDLGTDTGSVPADPPVEATGEAMVETAPWRIPLYDYADVPLDGPDAISYRRMPHDFMRALQVPINRMTDPEDDRYWLVTAEPRLTYRRLGRVPSAAPLVKSITLTQVPLVGNEKEVAFDPVT